MAIKKEIKVSEARILVYLSQVPKTRMNLQEISGRLDMDYAYTIRILSRMVYKGWVFKHRFGRQMAYDLREGAPVEKAKVVLAGEDIQMNFDTTNQTELTDAQ